MKKNKYIFTFGEVINILKVAFSDHALNKRYIDDLVYYYRSVAEFYKDFYSTMFDPILDGEQSFMSWYKSDDSYKLQDIAKGLLDKLAWNYKDYGCITEYLNEDEYNFTENDVYRWFTPFVVKFVNLFDEVYPRYSTLLGLYESNKNALIGKLQSSTTTSGQNLSTTNTSHSNSNSNSHIYKDTPESQIAIDDDKYNSSSDFNEGADSGSSSSSTGGNTSGTAVTNFDKDLIINQLNEVQEKYRNLVKDFINEFRGLFFEFNGNFKVIFEED